MFCGKGGDVLPTVWAQYTPWNLKKPEKKCEQSVNPGGEKDAPPGNPESASCITRHTMTKNSLDREQKIRIIEKDRKVRRTRGWPLSHAEEFTD